MTCAQLKEVCTLELLLIKPVTEPYQAQNIQVERWREYSTSQRKNHLKFDDVTFAVVVELAAVLSKIHLVYILWKLQKSLSQKHLKYWSNILI